MRCAPRFPWGKQAGNQSGLAGRTANRTDGDSGFCAVWTQPLLGDVEVRSGSQVLVHIRVGDPKEMLGLHLTLYSAPAYTLAMTTTQNRLIAHIQKAVEAEDAEFVQDSQYANTGYFSALFDGEYASERRVRYNFQDQSITLVRLVHDKVADCERSIATKTKNAEVEALVTAAIEHLVAR